MNLAVSQKESLAAKLIRIKEKLNAAKQIKEHRELSSNTVSPYGTLRQFDSKVTEQIGDFNNHFSGATDKS